MKAMSLFKMRSTEEVNMHLVHPYILGLIRDKMPKVLEYSYLVPIGELIDVESAFILRMSDFSPSHPRFMVFHGSIRP